MNSQHYLSDMSDLCTDANHLLTGGPWDIHQGLYLESPVVCVLVDPYPADGSSLRHVPITFLPLQSRSQDLADTPLSLTVVADPSTIYYGRLNRRGQVLFRNMPPGSYRAQLHAVSPSFQKELATLPEPVRRAVSTNSVLVQQLPSEAAIWNYTFRSASGSMWSSMSLSAQGELLVAFQTSDPKWAGQIAVMAWSPRFGGETDTEGSQFMLAVPSWHEQLHAWTTEINLGRPPTTCDVFLPHVPLPVESLSAEFAEIVSQSVARAASAHAWAAWRQLLVDSDRLHPIVSSTIDAAVSHDPFDVRNGAVGRHPIPHQERLLALRKQLAAIWHQEGERLYRLIGTIVIRVGETAASFGALPGPLTLRTVPAHALRSQKIVPDSASAADEDVIEMVSLPHHEANLVLTISIGPSGDGRGTIVAAVNTLMPRGPIAQAKVSLRDADDVLLDSTGTDDDGLAVFRSLDIGAYVIVVDHDGCTLKVLVSLEAVRLSGSR